MTPLAKLTKARSALITGHPFFGSLALQLRLVEREDIRTCGVDGVHLFWNPAFVESLQMPELTGVVAHEVMHIASGHIFRLKGRDHKRFNVASDHSINHLIVDAGLSLPKDALLDRQYRNMSAEEIYAKLPKSAGQGAGDDPGGCGAFMEPSNEDGTGPASEAEVTRLAEQWKVAMTCAANAARAAGKMPASLRRLVDEILAPQIDWREILRRFIANAAPSDHTWARPNRRHLGSGLYLPSMQPDHLSDIAVFVDTSGSISARQLAEFAAELNAILDEAKPDKLTVIYCDARVQKVDEFTPMDYPVRLEAHGGGGTDFRPPFEYLEREGITPTVCIYMTDLECSSFPSPPQYDVMWLCTGRPRDVPFGTVTELK